MNRRAVDWKLLSGVKIYVRYTLLFPELQKLSAGGNQLLSELNLYWRCISNHGFTESHLLSVHLLEQIYGHEEVLDLRQ
uniref:Uncharacterized protein n=1 Tax=Solanum lycopersicum TaxID=4081 RepID=A0A3Q7HHF0_SOLLC